MCAALNFAHKSVRFWGYVWVKNRASACAARAKTNGKSHKRECRSHERERLMSLKCEQIARVQQKYSATAALSIFLSENLDKLSVKNRVRANGFH